MLDYSVVSTESTPTGQTIDIRALNLMPITPDQLRWEYQITDAAANTIGYGSRHIVKPYDDLAGPTAEVSVADSVYGGAWHYITYYVEQKSDGLYIDYTKNRTIPAQTGMQIGLLREYAFDTYAIGEKRKVVRQGMWDSDLDSDGKPEQFRLEYTQVFHGFEPLTVPEHRELDWSSSEIVPAQTITVARFTNVYRFVITHSADGKTAGIVSTEKAYLAPGAGAIKYVRYSEDLDARLMQEPWTWTIVSLQNVSIR